MVRRGGAFIVGIMAACAVVVAQWCDLRLWVMFLGWTACFLFFPDIKHAAFAALHNIIGIALGMVAAIVTTLLVAPLGSAAAPLAVLALATGLMLLEHRPPFNNIPSYFIGLTIYFASGLAPGVLSWVYLTVDLAVGYAFAFATICLRGAYNRAMAG